MASVLEPVYALIATQLVAATSIDSCLIDVQLDSTKAVPAVLYPGGGDWHPLSGGAGSVLDRHSFFTLQIKTKAASSASLAMEEAALLWKGTGAAALARRAALEDLGCEQPPQPMNDDGSIRLGGAGTYIATIDFKFMLRYSA
jgi:hypothetical protein